MTSCRCYSLKYGHCPFRATQEDGLCDFCREHHQPKGDEG